MTSICAACRCARGNWSQHSSACKILTVPY